MDNTFKTLLLQFDQVGRYETPSRFNHAILSQDAHKLKQALEKLFNLNFTIDDQVQDASFLCDIVLPDQLVRDYKGNYLYSIRISNFGRLATIGFEKSFAVSTIEIIIATIEANGFHFIPADVLDAAYDGNFEEFKNVAGPNSIPRWWDRYFDYL